MGRLALFLFLFLIQSAWALSNGFVYLNQVDPSILQEMRYAGNHNFVGRPIHGYDQATCILTKEAAYALARVQKELKPLSLSLKVYDCYRPTRAVHDFWVWSKQSKQQEMKNEFYPNTNKADFFHLGYVAKKSGHSRGSTIDLTLVSLKPPTHNKNLAMGTTYDYLDVKANVFNKSISQTASNNRLFLRSLMLQNGFIPYNKEWWHFTLKSEPYPKTYFNFPVK